MEMSEKRFCQGGFGESQNFQTSIDDLTDAFSTAFLISSGNYIIYLQTNIVQTVDVLIYTPMNDDFYETGTTATTL